MCATRKLISDVLNLDWPTAFNDLSVECCQGIRVIARFLAAEAGPDRVVRDSPAWKWIASMLRVRDAGVDENLDKELAGKPAPPPENSELSKWRRSCPFGSPVNLISGAFREDFAPRIISVFFGPRQYSGLFWRTCEPEIFSARRAAIDECRTLMSLVRACTQSKARITTHLVVDYFAECFLGFYAFVKDYFEEFTAWGSDEPTPRSESRNAILRGRTNDLVNAGQEFARSIQSRDPDSIPRDARLLPAQGQTRQPGSRRLP